MKITTKTWLACASSTLLLAAVAAIGWGSARSADRAVERLVTEDLSRWEQVKAAKIGVLQCRRVEKDLLLSHDKGHVEAHERARAELGKLLQALQEGSESRATRSSMTDAIAGLDEYGRGFAALAAAMVERGLDENSGAEQQFRAAAHHVEAIVNTLADTPMRAAYLGVRRSEKDYLLRLRPEYVEKTKQALTALLAVQPAGADAAAMTGVQEACRRYEKAFLTLVACEGQIAAATEACREAGRRIERSIESITAAADEGLDAQTAAVRSVLQRSALVLAWLGSLATVLGGVVAFALVRAIRRPLLASVDVVGRLFRDGTVDLRTRFDDARHDEFGALGTAFNGFLQQVGDLVSRLREACGLMETGANDVRNSATELANSASNQAAAVQEMSATVQEMSSNVAGCHRHVQQAAALSQQACEAAGRGGEATRRLDVAMREVSESSRAITGVLATIDAIASQTNLLALNAAVEAARAGDSGRGFAVVAEEVRGLAARSAAAAADTQRMLEESNQRVQRSVGLAHEVTAAFAAITGSSTDVRNTLESAAQSSAAQTTGIEQVANVARQIDGSSQGTAAQSEQLSAAATSSADSARNLRDLVAKFTV